jgi:hypothetical protein
MWKTFCLVGQPQRAISKCDIYGVEQIYNILRSQIEIEKRV